MGNADAVLEKSAKHIRTARVEVSVLTNDTLAAAQR